MTIDFSVQDRLRAAMATRAMARATARFGGRGGPPTGGDMEQRVKVVEASIVAIEKCLAVITEQLKHVALREDVQSLRTDLAVISEKLDTKAATADLAVLSGKLDSKASATDLAELKGRVARIPTVPTLTSILLFVSLLFAAAAWVVRHLPETWSRALQ